MTSHRPARPPHRAPRLGLTTLLAALVLTVAGCVPAATPAQDPPAPLPSGDVRAVRAPRDLGRDDPLVRTAWEAWLRMELGRLTTGAYATDVLLELDLPAGVRWTVVEYGPDAYALQVTSDASPTALRVDPDGVHVRP